MLVGLNKRRLNEDWNWNSVSSNGSNSNGSSSNYSSNNSSSSIGYSSNGLKSSSKITASLNSEIQQNFKKLKASYQAMYQLKNLGVVGPKWANAIMKGIEELIKKYKCNAIPGAGDKNNSSNSTSSSSTTSNTTGGGGQIVDGKIGNFNVDVACQWILANTTPNSCKHNCAGVVEDAMQQGGLERPHCSDNNAPGNKASNLHHYNILADRGWKLISQGSGVGNKDTESNCDIASKVPGGLQKGDVAVIGWKETPPGRSFHATMWTGNKWVSDFQQQNCIPYGKTEYPYYIYRYSGSGGTAQEMAMKKSGGQQSTTVQQNGGVTYA